MAKTVKATKATLAVEEVEAPEVEEVVLAPIKVSLLDVKAGSLVGEIHDATVSFYHNGEEYEVDIRMKQLPFAVTDDLHKRMNNKEDVAFEWISKALVDEKGEQLFSQEQVEETFVQGMGTAIFEKVWGLDNIKKAVARQTAKTKKA
jgi:hypothetical protein